MTETRNKYRKFTSSFLPNADACNYSKEFLCKLWSGSCGPSQNQLASLPLPGVPLWSCLHCGPGWVGVSLPFPFASFCAFSAAELCENIATNAALLATRDVALWVNERKSLFRKAIGNFSHGMSSGKVHQVNKALSLPGRWQRIGWLSLVRQFRHHCSLLLMLHRFCPHRHLKYEIPCSQGDIANGMSTMGGFPKGKYVHVIRKTSRGVEI